MRTEEIKTYIKDVKRCPLFRKVPPVEIEEILAQEGTTVRELIIGERLTGREMYVILSGSVVIEKPASDGRFVTMNIAEAPAPINVAAALSKEKSDSRMTVETPGSAIVISGKTLEAMIHKGGQFAVNLAMFLTNRIGFLNKRINSLAGYSAASRLSMYLKEHEKDQVVEIPMSMTDFAEYLGVGRASLYRAVDSLEKAGKIRCNGRRIEIIHEEE